MSYPPFLLRKCDNQGAQNAPGILPAEPQGIQCMVGPQQGCGVPLAPCLAALSDLGKVIRGASE
eukprot:COSAG02_NODE_61607_length_268_cov_0.609467_1_plen_63_part_10